MRASCCHLKFGSSITRRGGGGAGGAKQLLHTWNRLSFTFPTHQAVKVYLPLLDKYYSIYPVTVCQTNTERKILRKAADDDDVPTFLHAHGKEGKDEITVLTERHWADEATVRTLPLLKDVEEELVIRTKDLGSYLGGDRIHKAMSDLVDQRIYLKECGLGLFCQWSSEGLCSDDALIQAIAHLCISHRRFITRVLVEISPTTRTTVGWVTLKDRYTLKMTCRGGVDIRLPTFDVESGFGPGSSQSWIWAFDKWKQRFVATEGRSWHEPIFPIYKGVYTPSYPNHHV